jgi:DNA-binding NarL/FixJ family response regulator
LSLPRCLLADDHPALCAAVASFLDAAGFEVLGPAADGRRALELARAETPELALVDYRMPRLAGSELVRELRAASPETRVVVYTADADETTARAAFDAGACGLVLKEAPLADLVRALETVHGGRSYLDPAVMKDGAAAAAQRLTTRELEVLTLLAEGLQHEDIGRRLGISSETVRTHLRKACDRLGAATRTQAVATAVRQGLIG